MRRNFVKSAGAAVVALPLTAGAAIAQTADAAETGVTEGFGKIQSIVDLSIPLMIGIAALVVAAMWGMKMLKKG